eukprot:m.780827 g.780827  ORF g.780827 m.780827 type:complete len:81 (-) comp59141_c0_seq1:355-597(-)
MTAVESEAKHHSRAHNFCQQSGLVRQNVLLFSKCCPLPSLLCLRGRSVVQFDTVGFSSVSQTKATSQTAKRAAALPAACS